MDLIQILKDIAECNKYLVYVTTITLSKQKTKHPFTLQHNNHTPLEMSRDLPSYSKLAEAIGTLCKLTILERFFAGINIYISIISWGVTGCDLKI